MARLTKRKESLRLRIKITKSLSRNGFRDLESNFIARFSSDS